VSPTGTLVLGGTSLFALHRQSGQDCAVLCHQQQRGCGRTGENEVGRRSGAAVEGNQTGHQGDAAGNQGATHALNESMHYFPNHRFPLSDFSDRWRKHHPSLYTRGESRMKSSSSG